MIVCLKRILRHILGIFRINPAQLVYAMQARKMALYKLIDRDANNAKPMINIGGSNFYKRHWRIMDYRHIESRHYDFSGMDYNCDLMSMRPFPLEDNSVSFFGSCLAERIFSEV